MPPGEFAKKSEEASRALSLMGSGKAGFGAATRWCGLKGARFLNLAVDCRKYSADVRPPALYAFYRIHLAK